jgi:hypothetical protein
MWFLAVFLTDQIDVATRGRINASRRLKANPRKNGGSKFKHAPVIPTASALPTGDGN